MIEMIVILVVLGLMLALVVGRGPMRSPALDARVAAREVAQALRLGRSRALALDRSVSVVLDSAAHEVRIDGKRSQAWPGDVAVRAATLAGEAISGGNVAITFAADGSSNGARLTLGESGFQQHVVVDWLTGLVRVDATK